MTTHLALQRMLLPTVQVSTLASGSISLPGAKQAFIPPVYKYLATATGDGVSTTFTFSNIDQTYSNLEIRGQWAGPTFMLMRLNGATTGYYYDMNRVEDTTRLTMNTQTNDSALVPAYNPSTGQFRNTLSATFPDYARTLSVYRTGVLMSGSAVGGTASRRQFTHGGQNSTAALTSLTIYANTAFDSKTKFTLWVY